MVVDLSKFAGSKNQPFKTHDYLIPLLLVAIVGLFIYYSGALNNIIPQEKINILVIGDLQKAAPKLYQIFEEESVKYNVVGYKFGVTDDVIAYNKKMLDKADLIILAGEETLDPRAAEFIKNAVEAGKNLLIIKQAGTITKDDPYYSSWNDELKSILPVELPTTNISKLKKIIDLSKVEKAYLYITDTDNPLFKGYGQYNPKLDFKKYLPNGKYEIFNVIPVGDVLLYLRVEYKNGTSEIYPLVVEKDTVFGGRVIYLGGDIGYITEAAKKLVRYAAKKL